MTAIITSAILPLKIRGKGLMDYTTISADAHIDIPWLPEDLGHLAPSARRKITCDNAARLYRFEQTSPSQTP